MRSLLILLFILLFLGDYTSQIQVNCDQLAQGKNTVKRGYLSSLEEYKNSLINKFNQYASDGYQMMMLHRKLNVDYNDSDIYQDYIDQATNNTNWIGYPEQEVYSVIDGLDTTYNFRVDDNFVNMLTQAADAGLEILFQLNGTFPDIEIDPNYKRVPYETRLIVEGSKKGEQHKEFEIPPPYLFDKYNTVISDWINAIEDSVRNRAQNASETKFIWCGSEEITHTIGWPTDENGNLNQLWLEGEETDSMRTKAKELNISRYTQMWSGLSKKLEAYGIIDGGIQLNAANIDQYSFFGDQLQAAINQPPMDFITIQNYKGHKKTTEIIDSLKLVIDQLRSFDEKYHKLKIIFDRYGFKKDSDSYTLSKSACSFLDAEQHIITNSEYFYGYCMMPGYYDSLIGDVATWLNNAPELKRPVINLPQNVNAMVFSNQEQLNLVVWNNSNSTFSEEMEIINLPNYYSENTLLAQVGSVDLLENATTYNFDYSTGTLSGFNLQPDDFALITLQAQNLPKSFIIDPNFESFLEANGMGDGVVGNDSVMTLKINSVDRLDLSNQGITDLSGIEEFLSLTSLKCLNNSLTNLDITQNLQLKFLNCRYNSITSLDVSQNTNLHTLICSDNSLSSLDVSQNSQLEQLSCEDNNLTTIDVSQNLLLQYFICGANQLNNLDVSLNSNLEYLGCHANNLSTLDVSNNTSLEVLSFGDNQIKNMDVSNNTSLIEFSAYGNLLKCLNLKNQNNTNILELDVTNNPNLNCIEVDDSNWAINNWTTSNQNIDSGVTFSLGCSYTDCE